MSRSLLWTCLLLILGGACSAAQYPVGYAKLRLPLDGQRVLALKHTFTGSPPRGIIWADTNFNGKFEAAEKHSPVRVDTAGMAGALETFSVGPVSMTGVPGPGVARCCTLELHSSGYGRSYKMPAFLWGRARFDVGQPPGRYPADLRVMTWLVRSLSAAVARGPKGPLRARLAARPITSDTGNMGLYACVGWPEMNWQPPPASPPISLHVSAFGFDQTVTVLCLPHLRPLSLVITSAAGGVRSVAEPEAMRGLLGGGVYAVRLPRGRYTATVVLDTGPVAGELTASTRFEVKVAPTNAAALGAMSAAGLLKREAGPAPPGDGAARIQWLIPMLASACVVLAVVAFLRWDSRSQKRPG